MDRIFAGQHGDQWPLTQGDGQITVAEFLEGAIRLRGLAKSVDLAQVGEGSEMFGDQA